MPSTIQSFIKGMNTDTDVSSLPKGSYRRAENFTFTTVENGTSGALENAKGNTLLTSINAFGPFDHEIVGYINIVKDIVFFTYKEREDESSIWLYDGTLNTTTLFYTDANTIDGSKLKFSTIPENRIVGVGRYENEKIRKIYWTDGVKEVRYANLERDYTDQPVDMFSLVPTIDLGNIKLTKDSLIQGGNLTAGSIQYAYKVYNKYGAESNFSSATKIFRLTKVSEKGAGDIYGTDIDEKVDRSLQIFFEGIDASFDYIRVYSIFYKSLKEVPVISLIHEGEIVTSDFTIIDTGTPILEIPFEEFVSIGGRKFTAKALASKNNILFAANVKEEYFDAEIDCRAYRFNKPTGYIVKGDEHFNSTIIFYLGSNFTNAHMWQEIFGDINNIEAHFGTYGTIVLDGIGRYSIPSLKFRLTNEDTVNQADIAFEISIGNTVLDSGTAFIPAGSYVNFTLSTIDSYNKVDTAGEIINLSLKETTSTLTQKVKFESVLDFIVDMNIVLEKPTGNTAIVENVNGDYITIESNGDWSADFTPNGNPLYTDWDLPTEFDAINKSNDVFNEIIDKDTSFLYNNNGFLGGTGKVVSYELKYEDKATIAINDELKFTDSFLGESVYTVSTHKRGEVYRYGIVFYDRNGRSSFVNWIGDILIPMENYNVPDDARDRFFFNVNYPSNLAGTVESNLVNIEFTVDFTQIDSEKLKEIRGYKIVMVERTIKDSSVKLQGIANGLQYDSVGDGKVDYFKERIYSPNSLIMPWVNQLYSPDYTIGKIDVSPEWNVRTVGYIKTPKGVEYGFFIGIIHAYETFPSNTDDVVINPSKIDNDILDVIYMKLQEDGSSPYLIKEGTLFQPVYSRGRDNDSYSATQIIFSNKDKLWEDGTILGTDSVLISVVEVFADVFKTQYGGNGYSDRIHDIYIPASEYSKVSSTTSSVLTAGDSFVSMYEQIERMWDPAKSAMTTTCVIFPVESRINLNFINERPSFYFKNKVFGPIDMCVMELATDGIARWPDAYPEDLKDLYPYNTAYSVPAYGRFPTYAPKPLLFEADQTNHVMITASEKKTNGEYIDSWTKFKYANFIEVDTEYGGVNELKSLDNRLFFWQEKAFGMLAVNDRSLISDSSGAQVSLGTGGVLERYDYLSNNVGVIEKYNVTSSENTVFWVYSPLERIYAYDNQIKELSTSGTVNSYLHNKAPFTTPISIVDFVNHETLFRINDEVLVYSWLSSSFTGVYTYEPYWFIKRYDGNYASVPNANKFQIWQHNVIVDDASNPIDRASYYGNTYDSYIKTVINEAYGNTKVFDNLSWFSTSLDSNKVNQYEDTFYYARFTTDYQNTDWVQIDWQRRERSFFMQIPRDKVIVSQLGNPDIFDSNNLEDPSNPITFKRRMRDKFINIELRYNNLSGKQFYFPYVNVNYRQSVR